MFEDYEPKEATGRAMAREICDWVEALLMAAICVVLLFAFVGRLSDVEGVSMRPTLERNDRLMITRMGRQPRQGDIVVVTLPPERHREPLVKRVIATEGQTIDIDFIAGIVLIDGQEQYEPYIAEATMMGYDMRFPQTVPEGHIFMMGDNRNNSLDSRNTQIGMVDNRHVLGRAVYRVFPYGRAGIP